MEAFSLVLIFLIFIVIGLNLDKLIWVMKQMNAMGNEYNRASGFGDESDDDDDDEVTEQISAKKD